MIEVLFYTLITITSAFGYRWLRTQRSPWTMFLVSTVAVAGIFGFIGSRIHLGHGNDIGWQLGLTLAGIHGFVTLVI